MATAQIPNTDDQHLRQTVSLLEQRVTSLESRLDNGEREPIPTPDIRGLETDIVRITQDMFPGEVAIRVMHDPEYPREPFHVVEAWASGDIAEIEDRRIEWHQRMRELSPGLGLLALSISHRK